MANQQASSGFRILLPMPFMANSSSVLNASRLRSHAWFCDWRAYRSHHVSRHHSSNRSWPLADGYAACSTKFLPFCLSRFHRCLTPRVERLDGYMARKRRKLSKEMEAEISSPERLNRFGHDLDIREEDIQNEYAKLSRFTPPAPTSPSCMSLMG